MSARALSRVYWIRARRDRLGLALYAVLPLATLAIYLLGEPAPARWASLLLAAWVVIGLLPAALAARLRPETRARWRALPTDSGSRWAGHFLGILPAPVVAGLLLAIGAFALAPAGFGTPGLFAVALLLVASSVALGVAVAAWSRSMWQWSALTGGAILYSLAPLVPDWARASLQLFPAGQGRLALLALNGAPGELVVPLVVLAMETLVFVILGVLGEGRA